MFSGNRCCNIWLLCTCTTNYPKKYIYSSATGLQFPNLIKIKTSSWGRHCHTVKMPKYGLSLIHHFPCMDKIIFVFSRIWTDSPILSKYGKIWIWFYPYTGKYRSEKVCILTFLCTVFLCQIFIMVWLESTTLSRTLRNFTNLLLLHPYS